jgi:hypothetical protein
MLRLFGAVDRHCDGLSRRETLRAGAVSLAGLTLPQLLANRAGRAAADSRPTAKSAIVLFMGGGFPHHESWDPKPAAPQEIRGDFDVIATRTPGLFVGELMPLTAQLTDRIAVIRSMVTGDNAHSTSGYQMLTGVPHIPLSRENAKPGAPNDAPAYNAILQGLRPSRGGLPASISLPRRLANNGGQDPWPGTDGGFLGRAFDPWLMECNPAEPSFTVPGGALPEDVAQVRLDRRLELLDQVAPQLDRLQQQASFSDYNRYQQQAVDLIAGGQGRTAFDLSREPDAVRDRYGRTQWGQSVLLARRLVEAGASLVQVQFASEDKGRPNGGGWDTHEKHSESLKGWLMPAFDQVYSALLLDLEARGLLAETLVCLVTEFGHTPRFNSKLGRDHWGRVFSIALAGGGIRGGIVHGASDAHASDPAEQPVRPCDYLATVFHCLGYSPETQVHDVTGRPLAISRGQVLDSLLG